MSDTPVMRTPSASPLDLSAATPELYAALAKAQAEVETVGKDAQNTQRGYKYASAEAMIRAVREPLTRNGLAFISTWRRNDETADPGGDIGKQFVCASVCMHWAITHANGGVIRGTCELDAIGSPARPPDKAVAATLTYMRGFILRDMLNLDRLDENPDESVDQRDESKGWVPPSRHRGRSQRDDVPRGTQRRVVKNEPTDAPHKASKPRTSPNVPPSQTKAADDVTNARVAMKSALDSYNAACEEIGVAARPWTDIAAEAIGQPWDTSVGVHPISDYVVVTKAFAEAEAAARLSVGDAVDAAVEGGE